MIRYGSALDDDLGRVPLEATTEWINTRNQVTCMLKNGKKLMKKQKVSSPMMHLANSSYRHPEPLGTALIMGAWNYPFDLTIGPLTGAIAAGNTAVIKFRGIYFSELRFRLASYLTENVYL